MSAVLQLHAICKSFLQAGEKLRVLQDVSLRLEEGEIVALLGASGSGKTTLLQIAGLLSTPDTGTVHIAGKDASQAPDRLRTRWRRDHIGFIYQFHHLLPEFSALENVMLPQIVAGVRKQKAAEHAGQLLAALGLGERGEHRPAQLSGGEQQRVAIARAMANHPALILADEPTGNLDGNTAGQVFNALLKMTETRRTALLIATHDMKLAQRADRILQLESGKLIATVKPQE